MLMALDVAIGLVLTFSLVSLIASLINEWISALLKMRGQMLWSAIDDLLGKDVSVALSDHAFLKGLRRRSWVDAITFWRKDTDRHKIGYLPKETFLRAAMATLAARSAEGKALPTKGEKAPEGLLAGLEEEAGKDLDRLREHLGATFDATMNEVSGWYKRWSQVTLFLVGLMIAFLAGVDSVTITKRLATDPELREAVGQQANVVLEAQRQENKGEAKEPSEEIQALLASIEGTGLPLLQAPPCREDAPSCATWERQWGGHWLAHWPGFLLTALATCLGAPFWFDLLKRLINLRSNFKPEPDPQPSEAT